MLSLGLRRGEALGLWWSDIDFGHRTVRIGRSLKWVKCTPDAAGQYPMVDKPSRTSVRRRQPNRGGLRTCLHLAARLSWLIGAANGWKGKQSDRGVTTNSSLLLRSALLSTLPTSPRRSRRTASGPVWGNRNLHQLRHSAATLLLAQDLPLHEVSEFLGHTSITITKDVTATSHQNFGRRPPTQWKAHSGDRRRTNGVRVKWVKQVVKRADPVGPSSPTTL